MPSGRPRRLLVALLGLAAFATAPAAQQADTSPQETKPEPGHNLAPPASRATGKPSEVNRDQASEGSAASTPNQAKTAAAAETGKVNGPSFDVVRVEPNGDSVIAGRGAPGATIEMLRNGKSHARAGADPSGLFAFVAPPLRPGSHEIALSSIAPDGSRAHSRESVTVVINEDKTTRPLVTMTSPDRPT